MKEEDLLIPIIDTDGGPWAKHNKPCPVFQDEHAVFDLNIGIFLPSWKAQREGWILVKVPRWLRWFIKNGYVK